MTYLSHRQPSRGLWHAGQSLTLTQTARNNPGREEIHITIQDLLQKVYWTKEQLFIQYHLVSLTVQRHVINPWSGEGYRTAGQFNYFFNPTSLRWKSELAVTVNRVTCPCGLPPSILKVWPWADLMFCSSSLHINRGIISLMLKLSFVHILLALTWVADTADKWLFLPATPPTSRSANQTSSSYDTGPFSVLFVSTAFGASLNIREGAPLSGTKRWSKISTWTFYCNFWPKFLSVSGSVRSKSTHQFFWIIQFSIWILFSITMNAFITAWLIKVWWEQWEINVVTKSFTHIFYNL